MQSEEVGLSAGELAEKEAVAKALRDRSPAAFRLTSSLQVRPHRFKNENPS